jgi:hypothetical protein
MGRLLLLFASPIPFLLAAPADALPKSVADLLDKPRSGEARLTWVDGRQAEGRIQRVTDQFVTLAAQKGSGACENVELSKISSIDWVPRTGNGEYFPLWAAPLLPALWIYESIRQSHSVRGAFLGDWRTTETSTAGRYSRVGFGYDRSIWREDVAVKNGTYRIEGGSLYVTYAGGSAEEAARLEFVCNELVLDAVTARHQLRFWVSAARGAASDPIIGRWTEGDFRHGNIWEFKQGGAFDLRITEHYLQGSFKKDQDTIRVRWKSTPRLPKEDWKLRLTGELSRAQLYITAGGTTTAYGRDAMRR